MGSNQQAFIPQIQYQSLGDTQWSILAKIPLCAYQIYYNILEPLVKNSLAPKSKILSIEIISIS